MKQYARCKPHDEGDRFPYVFLNGSQSTHPCHRGLHEQWMPEAIQDDEFNMVILLNDELVKVRSCHFDFVYDSIELSWSVDDVLCQDDRLTHDQCVEVLKYIDRYHDANHGITWEHIDMAIEDLFGDELGEREEEDQE